MAPLATSFTGIRQWTLHHEIKKLEILGFKSFRDKTPIDLSFDINAIVGPNGCGKKQHRGRHSVGYG